ncbi:hypothetical protein THH46_25060 [Pseudomonas sp. NA13]
MDINGARINTRLRCSWLAQGRCVGRKFRCESATPQQSVDPSLIEPC